MNKNVMSARQIMAIIIMFIFGSSVIMGVNKDAHQDVWVSVLMAVIMALPVIFMYARIIELYPGLEIYDIVEKLFGKIIGKIIILLMTWYAIHLGALVLRNFSEYIEISTLLHTPQIVVMIMLLSITIYIAKSNIEILGKWALVVLPILISSVIITIILSLSKMNFNNFLPLLEHDIKDISTGAFKIFTFPFAETVLFLSLADSFKRNDNPYKTYVSGFLLGGLILLIIVIRNLATLGIAMETASYFPSYTAARVIEIGDFLARIEGVITINFILAGITKITVCLIAGAKGIAKLFAIKNYKDMVWPTTLLILALGAIVYTNAMEMFDFINTYYGLYAIPFQIIIPIAIWIAAEIKSRRKKQSS